MGFGSSAPSSIIEASIASAMASFSTSRRGFAPIFLGPGAFFCFFELGGVTERRESSCSEGFSEGESSSSVSGFGRFFEVSGFVLSVVCDIFFGAALGNAGFLGAAFGAALVFGLGFCGERINKLPSSRNV